MHLLSSTLLELYNRDINEADVESVSDFSESVIYTNIDKNQRLIEFLKNSENPYLSKSDKIVVKVEYSCTSTTLETIFLLLLQDKNEG